MSTVLVFTDTLQPGILVEETQVPFQNRRWVSSHTGISVEETHRLHNTATDHEGTHPIINRSGHNMPACQPAVASDVTMGHVDKAQCGYQSPTATGDLGSQLGDSAPRNQGEEPMPRTRARKCRGQKRVRYSP